jgi:hypothetical protein
MLNDGSGQRENIQKKELREGCSVVRRKADFEAGSEQYSRGSARITLHDDETLENQTILTRPFGTPFFATQIFKAIRSKKSTLKKECA